MGAAERGRLAPRGSGLASGRAEHGTHNLFAALIPLGPRASVPDGPRHLHSPLQGLKIQVSSLKLLQDPEPNPLSLVNFKGPGDVLGLNLPSHSPDQHLILPAPFDQHLIKQQDEVDGKCQEEGKESQGVKIP